VFGSLATPRRPTHAPSQRWKKTEENITPQRENRRERIWEDPNAQEQLVFAIRWAATGDGIAAWV
jgi:hypothetical protein